MKTEEIEKQIIIPGFQKCGSTSLFNALTEHSKVSEVEKKEPMFYTMDKIDVEKYFDWYKGIYDDMPIDGSTAYLYDEENAVSNIERFVDDARVVAVIRDPAKRAFSAWLHYMKQMPRCDKRSFEEAVEPVPKANAEEQKRIEQKNLEKALEEDRIDTTYLERQPPRRAETPVYISWKKVLREQMSYVSCSRYSYHLEKLSDFDVYITSLEMLINKPDREFERIQNHLGLPREDLKLPHSNPTKLPSNKWIGKIYDKTVPVRDFLLRIGIYKKITPYLKKFLMKDKPSQSREQYELVKEKLEPEYNYWFDRKPELEELWQY